MPRAFNIDQPLQRRITMFKKLNKRGAVGTIIIVGVVLSTIGAGIALTGKHRARKAMEKCAATEPEGTNCAVFVQQVKEAGGLSGKRPAYIRDI